MYRMRRRPESRTRLIEFDGREWRVEERVERGPDDQERRCLVFSCNGESHRVHDYHWLWFGFLDSELAALCKSRRAVSVHEALLPRAAERQLRA
jgi:hypothetical protein